MAGYAVETRLGSGAIRIDRPSVPWRPVGPPPALGEVEAVEDLRVRGSWSSAELQERLEAVRRSWSQLTFYLFDPDSWR